jgi:hypothetical protein
VKAQGISQVVDSTSFDDEQVHSFVKASKTLQICQRGVVRVFGGYQLSFGGKI